MELSKRQEQIIEIVKENGPITGEKIAERLSLSRATLRPDLAILSMADFLEARPRVGYFYTGKRMSELITNKLKDYTVSEFSSEPVLVKEESSVNDAISSMFLSDVGTLFVVNGDACLVGVLSRKDLLRASLGNQNLNEIPVHIIMTRMPNIKMCTVGDLLIHAARKLIDNEIDCLPVVKNTALGNQVIGRISKTNITKVFVALIQEE